MDREIIDQKLESLRRCVQRIASKSPKDAATLIADFDLQDIVSLNLSRAVQISVDIGAHLISKMNLPPPDSMGQTFDLLAQAGILNTDLATRLKKAVGFRNIAIHSYERINWEMVFTIISLHLIDFSEFAKEISLHLQ